MGRKGFSLAGTHPRLCALPSLPEPLAASCPQEKTTGLPRDVAQDLRGLEAQLRRHEVLERELVGTERQVSPGLAASPTQARPGQPFL